MSDVGDPNDAATDSALRAGLRANPLSAEAMQRIRRATETEWRASLDDEQTTARSPSSTKWKFAAAAAVLLLAGAGAIGVYRFDGAATGERVATVIRSDAPGLELRRVLRTGEPVAVGADVRAHSRLQVRGDSLLSLEGGGNLRVARGSEFELPDTHTLRLTRGELYLDIPPGSRVTEPFVVFTPAGEFRHLGTQFALAIVGGQTRLRVREGQVLWRGEGREETVDAGTELLLDQRVLERRALPTAGREWSWVESLAPEIDIDNRPLAEFLAWFSRETGRKLEIADEDARRQASTILMHGSVRGLGVMEALAAVMASTTLHYELPAGAIRVSSVRAAKPAS